jgi:hypothetical protein
MIVKEIAAAGGALWVSDPKVGRTVYDRVGDSLFVPTEARARRTDGGAVAWRAEVGWAKKNLVLAGIVRPSDESGWGRWELTCTRHDG